VWGLFAEGEGGGGEKGLVCFWIGIRRLLSAGYNEGTCILKLRGSR
jgi:hypothetical protein